jgi:hypothetical protein
VALDRVKPLKLESIESGGDEDDEVPTGLDPTEDHIECAGVVFDDPGYIDETTVITRVGNDMLFRDVRNPVYVTLTQLLEGAAARDNRFLIFKVDGGTVYTTAGDVVEKAVDP